MSKKPKQQKPKQQSNAAAALFDKGPKKPDKKVMNLIAEFVKLKKQKKKAESMLEKAKEDISKLEGNLCTVMLSKEMKSLRLTNGILVSVGEKLEFFIDPEKKVAFFKHLKKINEDGMITTQVNYQTLQGYMGGFMKQLKNETISKQDQKKFDKLKTFMNERKRNTASVTGLK